MEEIKEIENENGQTMTEYVLLLLVVAIITVSVFQKIEEYIISNPDSFMATYVLSYQKAFQGGNSDFEGQYLYFTIRR